MQSVGRQSVETGLCVAKLLQRETNLLGINSYDQRHIKMDIGAIVDMTSVSEIDSLNV